MGVDELLLVDVEAMAMPFDGAGVLLENVSVEVGDGDAEIGVEAYAKSLGVGSRSRAGLGRDRDRGGAGGREYRPGGVFGKRRVVALADAENVVAQGGDLRGWCRAW